MEYVSRLSWQPEMSLTSARLRREKVLEFVRKLKIEVVAVIFINPDIDAVYDTNGRILILKKGLRYESLF